MISYLLNATTIWLLSLVCFELFLKKETSHGLNRAYLFATLLLGFIIPLCSWPAATHTYQTIAHQPLYTRASHTRQAVEEAISSTKSNTLPANKILAAIYVTGMIISLLFMLKEIVQLLRYYHTGTKRYEGKWLIIETGRQHSPFSLLHMIFISDRNAYSSDQWQIVLAHEQQHSRLYHFIDLLLLQFLQIALWFHPLVYIYRRKMLLVHEYQADAASAADLKQYGQFLLEQTMLHTAPAFTHSFNYSPIKNRILMLTRKKTSRTFSARYLLFFPVLLLSLACSKGKAPGGGDIGKWKREGNKATNNGNVIEFSLPEKDSVATIDPATGKETQTTVFTRAPEPLKLNGSRIYDDPETPPVYSGDEKWETVLFNLVREDLDKLDDGKYTLLVSNMVVDKKGTLIYYETEGLGQLSGSDDDGKSKGKMDEELKQRVNDRINSFLNDLRFKPATINGVPAIVVISFAKWIKVSNHHATIIQ